MPKYLDPQIIIPIMAKNLQAFVNMEDHEVTKYMCKLFEGVLSYDTIRRKMSENNKFTTETQKRDNGKFTV